MNDLWQREVLTSLLDKYERSRFFQEGTTPTRRIMLKLYDGGQCDFPQYDIEDSDKRITINRAIFALAERRLVDFQWMKGEENHILAKVWLQYENLSTAYATVGRKPKSSMIDAVCLEILELLKEIHTEWAKAYLQSLYETISYKRHIGNRLPETVAERVDLFRAIQYIDSMHDEEMLERLFSLQCYGDTKKFERTVKSRLLRILRTYLDVDEDVKDQELLRQVGIVKYPEQFEFCGSIQLLFESASIDFSCLQAGGSVCLPDLLRATLLIPSDVERILSIENRANYIDYIRTKKNKNEIVLYHGGQYSPSKKKFFQAIAHVMPEDCTWSHWGDIDYGGFSMLARLRREINPNIRVYCMDERELQQHCRFAVAITPSYVERLRCLLQMPELLDCQTCILYMMEHQQKLEQEAMLVNIME